MLQLMQLSLIFEALSNGHDDGDLTIKEACDAAGINIMFFGWLICVVSMQQFDIGSMAGRGDSSGHCVADSEISVIGPVRHSVEAFAKEGLVVVLGYPLCQF